MEALQKNNEYTLPIPIQDCIDLAYQSMKGSVITIDDIAAYSNITIKEAIKIITHPLFNTMVHQLVIANAKHAFDAVGFNTLLSIARNATEDPKVKINAIKTLGDMLGMNESKKQSGTKVQVNFNVDQIVRGIKETPFKGF